MKTTYSRFVTDIGDNKKRVDIFLDKKIKNISRTYIKNLILDGHLRINSTEIKIPSYKIKKNDIIHFKIIEKPTQSLVPYKFDLNIVFEDEDLIVIDKPSGISMHPGPGNYNNTIVNALIANGKKKLSSLGNELRPGIVHRIDKDTSGLVVIAKNNLSHTNLSKQFFDHSITRVYQCLVWGKLRPRSGRIETFITRSSKNRQMMEVSTKKGKNAVTNYKTLEIFDTENTPTFSLLECKLETGRTHQIRVHLSSKGNNILGDKKYKKKFKKILRIDLSLDNLITGLNRQFLHALKLGFNHPKNNERLEFSSNLPDDLSKILIKLRKIKQ